MASEVQEEIAALGSDRCKMKPSTESGQMPGAECSADKVSNSLSNVVADHYNKLDEKGLAERSQSRIFYLRNFNNWVKSMLIGRYLNILKKESAAKKKEVVVMDLACGKGGDLLKWKKGEIDYLVCADIAATSVEQCETRYEEMWRKSHFEQRPPKRFKAEFITADCTKANLKKMYKRKDIVFDLVSCQFSFHYCFESYPQVDMMLQNIAECLRPGGYFIATTPDANQIVSRLRNSNGCTFGNDVYSVTFPSVDQFPLFGGKYDFHLEGVVDCPEFLVYIPLLEKLSEKHGLRLIYQKRFDEFYSEIMQQNTKTHCNVDDGRQLLGRMQALETYPPFPEVKLVGNRDADYCRAEDAVKELEKDSHHQERVGTLSCAEWDAICMYVVLAFEKVVEAKRKREDLDDEGTSERSDDVKRSRPS